MMDLKTLVFMTLSWILTMLMILAVSIYGIYIGRKDEKRRRDRIASSRMAFDSKPKGM